VPSPLQTLLDFQPRFSGPFILAPFPTRDPFLEALPTAGDVLAGVALARDLANAIFGQPADVRTVADSGGNLIPQPARRLAETASFPVGASAQVPILPGSRLDPFGFVRPNIGRTGFPDSLRAA